MKGGIAAFLVALENFFAETAKGEAQGGKPALNLAAHL